MANAKTRIGPGPVFWEWVVVAYVLGILMLRFPGPMFAAALVPGLFFAAGRPGARAWLVIALSLSAGFVHARARLPDPPQTLPAIIEAREKVVLAGIVDEVVTKPGERLEIRLKNAAWDNGREQGVLPGRVAWTWDAAPARPMPGARVAIDPVRVKTARGFVNPGAWSYQFYRQLQGVFFRVYTRGDETRIEIEAGRVAWPQRLRARFREVLERRASGDGPGRGMPAALAMGDRHGLAPGTVELFRRAALAHSLALSGMHLGFVASLGFGLAWLVGAARPEIYLRLPRLKLGVLLAAPMVLFYVWLGGATPSLVRSAVMFTSFGLMLMLGRGRVLLDGLFAALAVILVTSPLAAFDIRLQFSAAAVAGIVVFFPFLWRLASGAGNTLTRKAGGPGPKTEPGRLARAARHVLRAAAACLLVSVCANLALFPLVVWNFGVVSPNLLPNLFWLPVMGAGVLPLTLSGMVLGAVPALEPVGGALVTVAGLVCDVSVRAIQAADNAGLIGETVSLRPHWLLILGYYSLLLALAVLVRDKRSRLGALVLAAGLAMAALPGMIRESSLTGGTMAVAALDTGQSQALVADFPGGSRLLVDGGGTWSGDFDMGRAVTAPVMTAGRPPAVDLMVMSHPDLDHSRGLLFPLTYFRVGKFASNGRMPPGETGDDLAQAMAGLARKPEVWRAGHVAHIGHEIRVEVLHPPEGFEAAGENDHSLALRLVWRGRGMALLPGDLEGPGLRAVLDSGADLSARLLVLPHHGGRSGLTPELLARVRPELAVACAGHLNYRRLPHADVRNALDKAGVPLLVTGESGRVLARWAGPDAPLEVETALP